MLLIALTWRQYISSWLYPSLASAWWSYLSPSLAVHMSCVNQQLSLLLLRQHSRTGHTSELLVRTYHCTGGLQTCWIVPAEIVALLWHPVTSSKHILVYCKVCLWWFWGCRRVECWQSCGQSPILLCCRLYSSLGSLTTCCWSRCDPTDVLIQLGASTSTVFFSVGEISSVLDEVCVLHTWSQVFHHYHLFLHRSNCDR